jgi:predicted ATP-dependent serine protease
VSKLKQRLKAAKELGFSRAVAPSSEEDAVAVDSIKNLVQALFSGK